MGRTDGKLISYLRQGLNEKLYLNLKWENDDDVFSLEFPRFEKSKGHLYEEYSKILKDWYKYTSKEMKYLSYSNAKAVFQAALKKSVYLISMPTVGKKIRFRFATPEESQEKKKLLKEKERSVHKDPLYTNSGPPSVSSSGYSSGEDMDRKNSEVEQDNSINSILEDIEKYFKLEGESNNLMELDNFLNMANDDIFQRQPGSPVQVQDFAMPFIDVKFYWQLSEKLNFGSVLLLIFKKQYFIESEKSNKEGDIVIPNEVWEEREYVWNNAVEVDERLFLFFQKK